MSKLFLIFVNEMGPNYLGNYVYEFIFGEDIEDVDGDDWGYEGKAQPPHQEFIQKVGILDNSKVDFHTLQKNEGFTMYDGQESVIALAWESYDGIEEAFKPTNKRLVFNYGETEQIVTDKLYSRDMTLKFKDI